MRKAGAITAGALVAAGNAIHSGMSTKELDKVIHNYITSHGAKPSFLGYAGFPGSACISVNDTVIHGIPSPDIKIAENKARPYVGLQGRILKKGPEELADVRAQVVSDYQDYKEKEWLNKLRAASKIEVFDDVVKTVNNH